MSNENERKRETHENNSLKEKKKSIIQWTQGTHHIATWLLLFGANVSVRKATIFLSCSLVYLLFLSCGTLFCPILPFSSHCKYIHRIPSFLFQFPRWDHHFHASPAKHFQFFPQFAIPLHISVSISSGTYSFRD